MAWLLQSTRPAIDNLAVESNPPVYAGQDPTRPWRRSMPSGYYAPGCRLLFSLMWEDLVPPLNTRCL